MLFVDRCMLFVVRLLWFVAGVCCVLCVVCASLLFGVCFVFVDCSLLFVVWFVLRCLLCVV